MAERVEYLTAVVGMDITQFRRGSANLRNEFGLLSEKFHSIGKLAQAGTYMFTTPMVALGTASIGAYTQFEASMQNINAIAQMSAGELDSLSDRVRAFGETSRAGVVGSAEALYTVFSAGIMDTEKAFSTMEIASRTAEAGLADMTTTTNALVASMLSYGDVTPEFAQRASDALTNMVAVGVGSMQNFATGISKVIPTASALGMSIEELYGDLAFLTQRGIKVSEASTALNSALTSLAKPTEAMKQAFRALGVDGAETLITKFGGVNEAMVALVGTTNGTQEQIQALFNNVRGSKAVNTFINNLDDWRKAQEEFNTTVTGATDRAWEEQMKSLSAKFDLLKSAGQSLLINIGDKIEPFLTPIVEGVTQLFLSMANASDKATQFMVAIAGIVSAIFPLTWIIVSLLNPLNLLIAGFAMFSSAFATNFGGVRDSVMAFVDEITGGIQPLIDVFNDFWDIVFPSDVPDNPYSDIEQAFLDRATKPSTITINPSEFITVTEPKSLWQIYEENGWQDKYDWQTFMQLAKDGGWVGGVINPSDVITIANGDEVVIDLYDSVKEAFMRSKGIEDSIEVPNIFERIFEGASTVWADLKPILETMWTNFTTWVDEKAGEGFNKLAEIFVPTGAYEGKTPFYDAIVNLFTTDVGGAVAEGIEGALPNATAGFGNFISSLGNWILNDGIPTIARSLGFFAGRIAVLLGTALDMLRGNGVGEASDAIGTYMEDGIADPLKAGWMDATQGLEGDVAGKALSDFASSIGDWFANDAITAVAWGIGKFVGSVGLLIGDAFNYVFNGSTGGEVGDTLGNVLDSFSKGFQDATSGRDLGFADTLATGLLGALGTAITAKAVFGIFTGKGVFTAIGSGLSMGMGGIVGALKTTFLTTVGGAVAGGVLAGFSAYMLLEDTLSPIREDFWTAIGKIVDPDNGNYAEDVQRTLDQFWQPIFDNLGMGIETAYGRDYSIQDHINKAIAQIQTSSDFQQLGYNAWAGVDMSQEDIDRLAMYNTSIEALRSTLTSDWTATTMNDTALIMQAIGYDYLPEMIAKYGITVTETDSLTDSTDSLKTAMQTLLDNMNLMSSTNPLDTFKFNALQALTSVENAVNKVITAFNTITGFSLGKLNLGGVAEAVTNLNPPTDAKPQASGLDYVPYDGYLARLHKGERVMTRADNAMFSKSTKSADVVNTNNTITIYAVMSGHEIVEKLEQIGIYVKNLRG